MKVKSMFWVLSVLLCWMAWPAGVPGALANGPAGSSGCVDGTWAATSRVNAPGGRESHTAVWTGAEMIVWGGNEGLFSYFNSGGRYDPESDTWTATSMVNAPSARSGHTAVWTGSEMIVWGGYYYDGAYHYLNTGDRYDPATNTWTAISTINAPSGRWYHTAVWTGSEMIVWGGSGGSCCPVTTFFNTGGRYDPETDTWTTISTEDAPSRRQNHTAVWTGTEMIVWGGGLGGGRYDPESDTWTAISTDGAPSARWEHTAVWTGTEMLVWGGFPLTNTGGRYDPETDTWTATSTVGAPSVRDQHTAVWTGLEMIVWGGRRTESSFPPTSPTDTGGRYDPATDTWTATTTVGALSSRGSHTAVWTGAEMLAWGGYYSYYYPDLKREIYYTLNTGGRYCASADIEGKP